MKIEYFFQDKVVLITGGAGCIGSNLSKRLSMLGAKKIIVYDNLSSSYEWNLPAAGNIIFLKADICNKQQLEKAFEFNPQIIFHLAAHFANQNSVDFPEVDLEVNGQGLLRTLMFAKEAQVQRFIYASSGCGVYGLESRIPFKEENISIHLHTPYQVTKLLGELYCNYFYNLYGLPIVNARFFNVYGPGEVPGKYRNVIPNFIYWAMHQQPLPITGDGSETRDWTYVSDIVDGLLAMCLYDKAIGQAINLGSGVEHRVIEMAELVNHLTNNPSGLVYKERRNWDVKTRLLSSIDKAKEILHYQPKMFFEKGVEQVYHWFVQHWDDVLKSAEF